MVGNGSGNTPVGILNVSGIGSKEYPNAGIAQESRAICSEAYIIATDRITALADQDAVQAVARNDIPAIGVAITDIYPGGPQFQPAA